jgi:hypothetical protein
VCSLLSVRAVKVWKSPCETTKITNQIFSKVGLLTSERQIGVLPEGGGGRESKEGDSIALRKKAMSVLVGGRTRRWRTSEERRGGGAR